VNPVAPVENGPPPTAPVEKWATAAPAECEAPFLFVVVVARPFTAWSPCARRRLLTPRRRAGERDVARDRGLLDGRSRPSARLGVRVAGIDGCSIVGGERGKQRQRETVRIRIRCPLRSGRKQLQERRSVHELRGQRRCADEAGSAPAIRITLCRGSPVSPVHFIWSGGLRSKTRLSRFGGIEGHWDIMDCCRSMRWVT
jgi:hypothetical protein